MENESDSELIPVRLTEEEWAAVTLSYVITTFRPESVQVYLDAIEAGKTTAEAAYDAIRNEAVNEALERALNHLQQLKGDQSNDNTGIV